MPAVDIHSRSHDYFQDPNQRRQLPFGIHSEGKMYNLEIGQLSVSHRLPLLAFPVSNANVCLHADLVQWHIRPISVNIP